MTKEEMVNKLVATRNSIKENIKKDADVNEVLDSYARGKV